MDQLASLLYENRSGSTRLSSMNEERSGSTHLSSEYENRGEGSEMIENDPWKLTFHRLPPADRPRLNEDKFFYETIWVQIAGSKDKDFVNFCFEKFTWERYKIWVTFFKTVQGYPGISPEEKEAIDGMITDLDTYRKRNEDRIIHTWFAYTTVRKIGSHRMKPEILPEYIESFMIVFSVQHFQVKIFSPVANSRQYLSTVEAGKAKQHQNLPMLLNGWASKALLVVDTATGLIVLPDYSWITSIPEDEGVWNKCYKFYPLITPENPESSSYFSLFKSSTPSPIVASYSNVSGRKVCWKLQGVYQKTFQDSAAKALNWIFIFDLDQMRGVNPFVLSDLYDPVYSYVQPEFQNVYDGWPDEYSSWWAQNYLEASCLPGDYIPRPGILKK